MSEFGEALRETRRKGLVEIGGLKEIAEWDSNYKFFKEVLIPFHKVSEAIPGFAKTDILSDEDRISLAVSYAPKGASGWALHQGASGFAIDYYFSL